MGAYLFMWGLFTSGMFIVTLKLTKSLQVVFFGLAILFFLLSAADITGNAQLKVFAGYEGILVGLSAIYTAMAQLINEVYGRRVLPL